MGSIPVELFIQISYVDLDLTDECISLLSSYQNLFRQKCSQLVLEFDVKTDMGVYDAINIAVRNISSSFVAICGAGDFFYLNIIEEYAKLFCIFDVSVFKVAFLSGSCIYKQPSKFFLPFRNICHQGMIFRRSVLLERPYSMRYPILSDYHWNLVYLKFFDVHYFDAILSSYDNTIGLSKSEIKDLAFVSDKYNLILSEYNILMALMSRLFSAFVGCFSRLRKI